MTQPDTSDIRARALEIVPEIAKVLGVSRSEARMKIAAADEEKLAQLVDAFEQQQQFSRLLGFDQ